MKVLSKNLEETNKVAKDFLNKLSPKADSATIVGLFGDLGSGKTTFTQALAKHLNVSEVVTSPTFVIEKIYLLNSGKKLLSTSFSVLLTEREENFAKAEQYLTSVYVTNGLLSCSLS